MFRCIVMAMLLCGIVWGFPATCGAKQLAALVSVVPQRYFVERVGGDRVAVSVMVEPGASPATYEPTPRQMAEVSRSDIYFAVGVPFEDVWLPRFVAANPDMRIVHTEAGVPRRMMQPHHHGHDHDHATANGEESHEGSPGERPDPHIWLSPELVKQQARNIAAGLAAVDPAGEVAYTANLDTFLQELDQLDAELRAILAASAGSRFMVYHPAWGYFAAAYGLVQVPVEAEGKEPGPRELQELIAFGREQRVRALFVQPQFSAASARAVASEIGAEVVILDPLAQDWRDNLSEAARAIAQEGRQP